MAFYLKTQRLCHLPSYSATIGLYSAHFPHPLSFSIATVCDPFQWYPRCCIHSVNCMILYSSSSVYVYWLFNKIAICLALFLSLSVYVCVCINYATFWLTSDTVYNVKCVHVCVCNGLHLYFVRIQNAFFISVAVFFLRCSCHRINSNGGMVRCGGDGKNKREKCSFTIRTRAPYSLYMLN